MHAFWALVERTLPRIAAAVVMLGATWFVAPEVIGLYSWMTIILLATQALLDSPIRQIAVPVLTQPSGDRFLLKFRILASATGVMVLVVAAGVLATTHPGAPLVTFMQLLPVAFVPVATSFGVRPVARLQSAEHWRALAGFQTVAAVSSFTVSLPLLFLTQSLWAVSTQALLAEGVMTVVTLVAARRLPAPTPIGAEPFRAATELAPTVGYFMARWAQGQLDRVIVGLVAGTSMLAIYSLAVALSRSVGEVVSVAAGNVYRVRLVRVSRQDSGAVVALLSATLVRQTSLAAIVAVAVALTAKTLLPVVLPSEWSALVGPTIILAAGCVSLVPYSILVVTLVYLRRMKWASRIRFFGVALAVPVGLTAYIGLEAVAWASVARDALLLVLTAYLMRDHLRTRAAAISATLVVSVTVVVAAMAVL